jgi:hypothetical protein
MTENTQMEQSYNLTLAELPYDEKYKLNQASASQLVKGLSEMGTRLGEPTNEYQKELYPALKTLVTTMVTKYTDMLQATTEVEREVRRFNLHGYNGRVKKPVATRGVKFNVVYKFANFGDYLKSLTQRLTYLVERPVPQRYVNNASEGTAYEQLKGKLQDYLKFMKEEVEQQWNTAVTSARTAGGDSVQENLRKRTERVAVAKTTQQEKPQQPRKPFVRRTTTVATETYGQQTQRMDGVQRGGRGGMRGKARGGARTQWSPRKSS